MPVPCDKLERQAPELVSLAKKAQFNLSKHGLDGQAAEVALCLDHSGSMRAAYTSGAVQALAERVLALATQLDDDGSIDVFFFGLDDLAGRVVDNADDQAVPDVSLVKDQALFDLMLVEHAEWLAAVRAAGMLG